MSSKLLMQTYMKELTDLFLASSWIMSSRCALLESKLKFSSEGLLA